MTVFVSYLLVNLPVKKFWKSVNIWWSYYYYKHFCLEWHYHTWTLQGHLTNIKQSRVNSDAAQVLASSPKDVPKSTVFSCCRKAASDCWSLTKDSREFKARAAAAGNSQSPWSIVTYHSGLFFDSQCSNKSTRFWLFSCHQQPGLTTFRIH